MKSLLSDLRSCYRAGTSKRRPSSSATEALADQAPPSRTLSTGKKPWRPVLNAISEDGVATTTACVSSKSCKDGAKKSVAKSRSIASFDSVDAPVIIPMAYYPSPFMF